ncbi:MAG TPA: hypothetical protein VHR37_09700 [Solirubrobacterales bacterium]|jgi:type 1 fimbria pilin|nr:hypothetical protein [Solirubrobacterales bacterium]
MRRKFAVGVCVAAVTALTASPAFAGEVTGNGTFKGVNGNSPCAYSGQEDLQYLPGGEKGVGPHSQNFGHVKQDPTQGVTGGANSVPAWDWGCNGHEFGLKP